GRMIPSRCQSASWKGWRDQRPLVWTRMRSKNACARSARPTSNREASGEDGGELIVASSLPDLDPRPRGRGEAEFGGIPADGGVGAPPDPPRRVRHQRTVPAPDQDPGGQELGGVLAAGDGFAEPFERLPIQLRQ